MLIILRKEKGKKSLQDKENKTTLEISKEYISIHCIPYSKGARRYEFYENMQKSIQRRENEVKQQQAENET